MQALKSGIAIKAVVQLVGGSTSGFSKVAAEYWTIVVTTIVVSVICLASAIAAYVIRTDQRMRQDRHYGGAPGGGRQPGRRRAGLGQLQGGATTDTRSVTLHCTRILLSGLGSGDSGLSSPSHEIRGPSGHAQCTASHTMRQVVTSLRLARLPGMPHKPQHAVCAISGPPPAPPAGEHSARMYRVYQVLTTALLVIVFFMASFFVVLVGVNVSGAPPPRPRKCLFSAITSTASLRWPLKCSDGAGHNGAGTR